MSLTQEEKIALNITVELDLSDLAGENDSYIYKELHNFAKEKYAVVKNEIRQQFSAFPEYSIINKVYDAFGGNRKRGVNVSENDVIELIIKSDRELIRKIEKDNQKNKTEKIKLVQSFVIKILKESEKLKLNLGYALGTNDVKKRSIKIAEALGVNSELVVVQRKNGEFNTEFLSHVVEKVIKKNKSGYRLTQKGSKKYYTVSKDIWAQLLREQSRFQALPSKETKTPNFIERKINAAESQIKEIEEINRQLQDPGIVKILNRTRFRITEDNKEEVLNKIKTIIKTVTQKKKKEIIQEAKNAARELKNQAKKQAYELRDAIRSQDIKNSRPHYAPLKFQGKVNTSNFIDADKIVQDIKDEVYSEIEKEFGVKRNKFRVANISSSQRLVDSEHIHKPYENTLYTSYEPSKSGKRMKRNVSYRPKTDVEKIYESTLDLHINLLPEWEPEEFKVVAILKPSIVKQATAKWKEKKNGETTLHEVDYGCLLAATYFYTLVSNTPIDEKYRGVDRDNYWSRPRLSIKKQTSAKSYKDPNKSLPEIKKELNENRTKILNTRLVEREHKPDEESVRGDWVMTFRGVTFKAFDSEPANNSENVTAQVCFKPEDFMNPVTDLNMPVDSDSLYTIKKDKDGNEIKQIKNTVAKPYIWKIAEIIAKNTEPSDDISIEAHNINPRWQILEFGGYKSKNSGPWKGSGKYGRQHGVKNGFSWQAPIGFKRVTDAQYNAIITKSSLYKNSKGAYGNASSYTRPNRDLSWNFDITKMDQSQYTKLRKLFNEQDKTLAIDRMGNIDYDNIHNIDAKLVWKLEEYK